MAEFISTEQTNLAAGGKMLGVNDSARIRRFFREYVAPAAAPPQIADTIYFGTLPRGARVIRSQPGVVSCNAGVAAATMAVGARTTKDKTAISATQFSTALAITAAGEKPMVGGAAYASGVADYVPAEEIDVFGTIAGAAVAVNQRIMVEILYVLD